MQSTYTDIKDNPHNAERYDWCSEPIFARDRPEKHSSTRFSYGQRQPGTHRNQWSMNLLSSARIRDFQLIWFLLISNHHIPAYSFVVDILSVQSEQGSSLPQRLPFKPDTTSLMQTNSRCALALNQFVGQVVTSVEMEWIWDHAIWTSANVLLFTKHSRSTSAAGDPAASSLTPQLLEKGVKLLQGLIIDPTGPDLPTLSMWNDRL